MRQKKKSGKQNCEEHEEQEKKEQEDEGEEDMKCRREGERRREKTGDGEVWLHHS
jgi:hypothetical protein